MGPFVIWFDRYTCAETVQLVIEIKRKNPMYGLWAYCHAGVSGRWGRDQ
jgi:hypothetical protein